MSKKENKENSLPQIKKPERAEPSSKEERLAAALKANIKRRKAAARQRQTQHQKTSAGKNEE